MGQSLMKIVCDDKIPFLKGVFEPFAQVCYLRGAEICAEDVKDADALIIRTRTRADEALLGGSRVRIVASATIGFDHIDTRYCERAGIAWTNAPGCNAASVCQWFSSTLEYLAFKHQLSLRQLRLGIVGVGNVGSKVRDWAESQGIHCLLCDPPKAALDTEHKYLSLEEVIAGSDVITLHVPLNESTFHLFDERIFHQMKAHQILVNSSRGEVVEEGALIQALEEGRLLGAALDVWEHEPLVSRRLIELLDIATPHIAGYSTDGKAAGTQMAVRAVARELGIREREDWHIEKLPEAEETEYDVLRDDKALREKPEDFEKLRSDYPIRREALYRKY